MPVTNLNQYLTQGAIEGFVDLMAPLNAFSYVVKPAASALNDVVRVPFSQNTSASVAFAYGTGYTADGNTITGKSVTLDKMLYQKITLTDSDLVLLSPEALIKVGRQAGMRLANDVMSASFAATINVTNFANTGSGAGYVAASVSSSAGLVALDKAANDLKWPDAERSIIGNTTVWSHLLNNSIVTNASAFGTSEATQKGKLTNVLGFTPYKVTTAIPNSWNGFIVNPNAMLMAIGYHAPTDDGKSYLNAQSIEMEGTDLRIGFREYYDPVKASKQRVFDVLFGSAVGDGNALVAIK